MPSSRQWGGGAVMFGEFPCGWLDKSRTLAVGLRGSLVVVVFGPSVVQAANAKRQAHVRQLPMNFFMPSF
jgi:hypothetical protein